MTLVDPKHQGGALEHVLAPKTQEVEALKLIKPHLRFLDTALLVDLVLVLVIPVQPKQIRWGGGGDKITVWIFLATNHNMVPPTKPMTAGYSPLVCA